MTHTIQCRDCSNKTTVNIGTDEYAKLLSYGAWVAVNARKPDGSMGTDHLCLSCHEKSVNAEVTAIRNGTHRWCKQVRV